MAVGLNYHDHIQEFGHEVPDHPILFIKPSTAVLEPGGTILLPPQSNQVDFEGELAVVIKQTAYQITVQAVPNYILGYTCFNDVTARDLQRIDGQWTRAKSFDTFAPIGPWITPELNPDSLQIITRVNGTIRQQSNTKHLVFPIYELVSFISHIMTLLPGDIIATGTPSGVGPLKPGDRVDIEIEGWNFNESRQESIEYVPGSIGNADLIGLRIILQIFKIFPPVTASLLNKFVLYISFPCLVFGSYNQQLLASYWKIPPLAFSIITIIFLLAYGWGKYGLRFSRQVVQACYRAAFGNTAFLGYPL